jgi:glucokinase
VKILAGDIGGTKTALALVAFVRGRPSLVRTEKYPSASYAGLAEIVEVFLERERERPAAAGFGVAGPVRRGISKVTKLPWVVDQNRLAAQLGIKRVSVVNDFVAAALGLSFLGPRQAATLARGFPEEEGPVGVLGAGTGLGQAVVARVRGRDEVIASEGGHADFGPRTPLEDRLVAFLRRRFGRASRDRILSGGGLVLLYEFLREDGRAREKPEVASELASAEDRAQVISRLALGRRDALCREALDLFVSIYGSEAGNLALQYRATGGVFLAGGIAPKILPALRQRAFLEAFRRKSPMEKLLARIPVRVVLDPRLGLYGAAAAGYRTTIETTRPSRKTRVRRASL